MELHLLKPKKALNKAFLKVKPNRTEIEGFKSHLIQLLDHINDDESEEFHKNLVIDFLKKTYYDPNHFVNTKGRNDLVIHNGDKATTPVGVIIEAKKPTNRAEMVTKERLNVKAFQELVLYYLRERITQKNIEVKHLIITNINEWFIFDAIVFDRLFAQNKGFVKQFQDFEEKRLADISTDFFYKQVAEPFIAEIKQNIEFTYFDIRDYEKPLRNNNQKDDNQLIALFKLLSPEHLLKLPFVNDSNSLDKQFYSELLHIIGLEETKEGSKKVIGRKKKGERNPGSLLENAIIQLDSLDKISRIENPARFGENEKERLFNVGLELSITWINRILFLKLLEAQLITYHKGDESYEFLNFEKIPDYDALNKLFFQVLAKQYSERTELVQKAFEKVPYLNSSLFEPNEMEHKMLFISNLEDEYEMPIYSASVLKDKNGKRRTGKINPLEYLFEFLGSYDFTSEGGENIQEENKTLINASVLGLIFEKINGYKDGSFFTPGFITMYMCRETIRKAVVQKFNEAKGWNCTDIPSLYDKIEDRNEANEIINDLKICDPAVGSGHFLVSALNEMIAIKNDLRILQDREGQRLKEYHFEVVNDELIVTDEEGELFEYNPTHRESQRVQETLFHEKQTLIENCLFGVDINPNSVKICRLRLWIELLKNAYYKNETELETLPNIDINIKCGNSLISRFDLDADLSKALRSSKWNMDSYRIAVQTYRNAENKEQKHEMERLIADIKGDFKTEISRNSKEQRLYDKLSAELYEKHMAPKIFEEELSRAQKSKLKKEREKLEAKVIKLKEQLDEIKDNKIYENAFEWRFEFPEVLDDEGRFVGFDVVIGNPPYVGLQAMKEESEQLSKLGYLTFNKTSDLYVLFCERGEQILKRQGELSFIIPNKWMSGRYGKELRQFFLDKVNVEKIINFENVFVFSEAVVFVCILEFNKSEFNNVIEAVVIEKKEDMKTFNDFFDEGKLILSDLNSESWKIVPQDILKINKKIENKGVRLKDWAGIGFYAGIKTAFNDAYIISNEIRETIILKEPKSVDILVPVLRGRNIKRYDYTFDNIYLVNTYNGETNPNGEGRINRVDVVSDYPIVFEHLQQFEDKLKIRKDQGEHWANLRNCAFEDEFSKEKIVWMEISDEANYTYDNQGMYLTNSAYFLTGHSIKYLIAVLNSKLCDFYFFQKTAVIAGGRKRYTKQYVEQNPIPVISEEEQEPFVQLVDQILTAKQEDPSADTTALENEIDVLVYRLYGLTYEEVKIVDEGFWMSEEEYNREESNQSKVD